MDVVDCLQNIADKAHFLRMELLACGNTNRAEELCVEIRALAMQQLIIIEEKANKWHLTQTKKQ